MHQSTVAQILSWCGLTASRYPMQRWYRSVEPCDVTTEYASWNHYRLKPGILHMSPRRVKLLYFTWWRHQMETSSASLALFEGNPPHKGPVTRSFVFSLICVWTNGWANNRDAGDLRRHRAHYDFTVMILIFHAVGNIKSCDIYKETNDHNHIPPIHSPTSTVAPLKFGNG